MAGLSDLVPIGTPRLSLHPLEATDADEMVTVLDDPALHQFTGGRPDDLDSLRRRYARWAEGSGSAHEVWRNWIVRRTSDGNAVGTVQATIVTIDHEPSAFVAWTIGVPWQSNGYATEATVALVGWLAERNVRTVIAHVHPDHHRSAAVAARAGMRSTGRTVDGEMEWRLDDAAPTDQST